MNYKLLIFIFHLLIVFPYLFYLGRKLELSGNKEYKEHSKILIMGSIMGFGFQLYLLYNLINVYYF